VNWRKAGYGVLLRTGLGALMLHQKAYELSDGRIGSQIGKLSLLLLRTKGAKTGVTRTSALLYGRDGDNLVIVGSKGGSDAAPAWLVNLQANPDAEVQVARRRWHVRARFAEGEERERLWRMMNTYWDYDGYQARTERRIPIVLLEPVQPGRGGKRRGGRRRARS
jgi:deazaflavin-dependent oxidoreductase (nitroreductase family)